MASTKQKRKAQQVSAYPVGSAVTIEAPWSRFNGRSGIVHAVHKTGALVKVGGTAVWYRDNELAPYKEN